MYVNVNCYHVIQPMDIEIYETLKRDVISYTPSCINCQDGSDPSANKARVQNGLEKALGTWPMLIPLANQLREISESDDEMFANLVMQVVHQIKYSTTYNIKFPVVTIGDGEGDCDNVSTLAAAIMKAGGLDSVVIVGPVQIGECFELQRHAIVGVHLSEPPDDLLIQNTNSDPSYPHYVDHNLKKYYVAEATPGRSFVGENPMNMDTEKPELVVETPDTPYTDTSKTKANNIRVNYIQ